MSLPSTLARLTVLLALLGVARTAPPRAVQGAYEGAAALGCAERAAPPTAPDLIHVREAQSVTLGSPDVVVAVVDSGVDYAHPDLASRVILGPSFAAPRGDDPYDTFGHGTFVASVVASVAPGVRILAVRAGDSSGPQLEDAVAAIRYAVDRGASVMNLSFSFSSGDSEPAAQKALDYALAHDVVVVMAAGNQGKATASAAAYPQAMRVTATTPDDHLADFANYGPWVDVAAPGTQIYGALPGNVHAICQGTSVAAPFASGVAALVRSAAPGLHAREVIERVARSADDIGGANPRFRGQLHFGRLNAHRAVLAAAGGG
jgi:thermitase